MSPRSCNKLNERSGNGWIAVWFGRPLETGDDTVGGRMSMRERDAGQADARRLWAKLTGAFLRKWTPRIIASNARPLHVDGLQGGADVETR